MTNLDQNRALVFGEVAEEYARWRPTYPDEAVAWLARDARTVVDLGAGTGQLTGALLDRGVTVHAVERDPRMLSVLAASRTADRTRNSVQLPEANVRNCRGQVRAAADVRARLQSGSALPRVGPWSCFEQCRS